MTYRNGWKPFQNEIPRKPRKKRNDGLPSEYQEQAALAAWLDRNNIRFFAIPNGGYRNQIEGAKFKRSGVKSGVPDLSIPYPIKPYHGLYIELKRQIGGKPSLQQLEWINFLQSQNYKAEICYGFLEAKELICKYLGLKPPEFTPERR